VLRAVLVLLLLAVPAAAQRTYWPVAVRGVVTYVGHEDDQDMHVRLISVTGSQYFVIAECIPLLPCRTSIGLPWLPKVGDTVTVYGISRRDPEHGNWAEIHPVEAISP